MKKQILILTAVLTGFVTSAAAPPPPGLPPPPSARIDNGVEILLAGGLFLAVYWIRKQENNKK